MNTLKLKFAMAAVLLSGSFPVSAHTGNHGTSSWYHYVVSADHAALFLLLVLSGLGILTYLARKPVAVRKLTARKKV